MKDPKQPAVWQMVKEAVADASGGEVGRSGKVLLMKHVAVRFGEYVLFVHSNDEDMDELLNEAQHRGTPLGGPYSAVKHPPHAPPGEYHLHAYKGNNQIFALNKSGTAHDQSHGVQIPNRVAAGISRRFPDWILPPDNFIESLSPPHAAALLMEGAASQEVTEVLNFREWLLLSEAVDGEA